MKHLEKNKTSSLISAFEKKLAFQGFQGKISSQWTDRISVSTDNSVYQVIPELLIRPQIHDDVLLAVRVLNEEQFRSLPLVIRAGGTGTNGQALNEAVVMDLGRHFGAIRELNLDAGWVEVDAGIILSQLNTFLAPHNVFFAPTTSTANRCSIGGMIGTDAAGKGSRIYGKTSDHVLGLDVVLMNGERLWLEPKDLKDVTEPLYEQIKNICQSKREAIKKAFPSLSRRLSGYDILTVLSEDGKIDPTRLICGAEGTLGIVLGARLKLTPQPKVKKLAVIAYADFIEAVASAQSLLAFSPSAIETIDSVVQKKALQGPLGKLLPQTFHPKNPDDHPPICNFVEFVGDNEKEVSQLFDLFVDAALKDKKILSIHIAKSADDQTALWNARKAAVGLLADCPPGPQPMAFVEDCVVPPENLAAFLTEFKALLDREGVAYGMFGHVDVGCMHVRPALDMTDDLAPQKLRHISDQVQELVRKYHGLLWGEHGKGFRGEYLAETVGAEVYDVMRQIKTLFDPDNRLNPGKLAISHRSNDLKVTKIDEAPIRGTRNKVVPPASRTDAFADAFRCNGNAQCLNSESSMTMCPSYKATGDLRHSPKGRADLLREWLKLKADNSNELRAFEQDLYPILDGCLSCKACTSSCPVHVDIPELKSRFLQEYHTRHKRPLRDYAFGLLEPLSEIISHFPVLAKLLMRNPLARSLMSFWGIKDAPPPSWPSIHERLMIRDTWVWSPDHLVAEKDHLFENKKNPVLLLVDGFNLSFDAQSLEDIFLGLQKLGFDPIMTYAGASGKAWHVKGFRKAFKKAAHIHMGNLKLLKSLKIPIVVAESSYLATLEKDYKAVDEYKDLPVIIPLHRFLMEHLSSFSELSFAASKGPEKRKAIYFAHCSEKTSMADVSPAWKEILERVGISVEIIPSGCCGMSGAFGHEAPQQETSQKLFDLTWRKPIEQAASENTMILASGFSCRCQVKRFTEKNIKAYHPLKAIL